VPYCIHRGGFHADDAAFCPFCGKPIGPPATPAPPEGISAVFGRMLVVFSIGFNTPSRSGSSSSAPAPRPPSSESSCTSSPEVLWMVVLPSVQVASMRFLSSDPPAAANTPPG
jgi:hypothetical protein